jgi:hypothetical protein
MMEMSHIVVMLISAFVGSFLTWLRLRDRPPEVK